VLKAGLKQAADTIITDKYPTGKNPDSNLNREPGVMNGTDYLNTANNLYKKIFAIAAKKQA
jgi:hypothetical protein